jgi:hypothetical protein
MRFLPLVLLIDTYLISPQRKVCNVSLDLIQSLPETACQVQGPTRELIFAQTYAVDFSFAPAVRQGMVERESVQIVNI